MIEMHIMLPDYETWSIVAKRKEGLRVRDVLQAIYDAFHVRLTSAEQNSISPQMKDYLMTYNDRRCRDAAGLAEYNKKQGLLRVDVLRSHRIFAGLEQDGKYWKLTLESYGR
ncbi:hypothetical protein AMATHDRAFT_143053 [Amanita thiersii Skay4041]|uniref:DUF6699 domain-containing protein n=1 Tax=Amanita thiersii Skay4041 TaxID=703135 RepID=A0A2A9NJP3_9AGAR|nr:hypothetical protein AMATHDRAFT_143053 [Amanita thiersii Skay4041]